MSLRKHCDHCGSEITEAPLVLDTNPVETIPWPYDEFDVVQFGKRNSGTVVRVKVRFESFGRPFDLCFHCFGMFLADASRQDDERERLRHQP